MSSRYWDSCPTDNWTQPNSNDIAEAFQRVCELCPNFYKFGLRTDFLDRTKKEDSDKGFFLGESHSSYQELLLSNRPGFLYFNKALEDLPIIFDTGASVSVSPDLRDFVDYTPCTRQGLTNITGESAVVGVGTIRWKIYSHNGTEQNILTKGYYVPEAKVRLFSVQTYLGVTGGSFLMEGATSTYCFSDGKILSFQTFDVKSGRSRLPCMHI